MTKTVEVFVSYAHEDEPFKDEFRLQIADLIADGRINLWDDRELVAGDDWRDEIEKQIQNCQIAICLVSKYFLASDFIRAEEFSKLLERHQNDEIKIFPVIVSPCPWKRSQIEKLQVLPKDGRAITSFAAGGERDDAWLSVGDAFVELLDNVSDSQKQVQKAPEVQAPVEAKPPPRHSIRQISDVIRQLRIGRLAIFLGEGFNRPGGEDNEKWQAGTAEVTPLADDLAEQFAKVHGLPFSDARSLPTVAQLMTVRDGGTGQLFDDLHQFFNADFPVQETHMALAQLCASLRDAGRVSDCPIMLTVNYDDMVERAFRKIDEPLDVLTFTSSHSGQCAFRHISADGQSVLIERPNEYNGLALEERPLLVKLAGTVGRSDRNVEHFVVTEDDFFSYAAGQDAREIVPAQLIWRLKSCYSLFLGYSISQWTRRVVLSRIFENGRLPSRSLIVNEQLNEIDWDFRHLPNIELLEMPLLEVVQDLLAGVRSEIAEHAA